jgi:hypothetical protein
MLCNVQANTNIAGPNREASVIMSALAIPTADLQAAAAQKCAPQGLRLQVKTGFNISGLTLSLTSLFAVSRVPSEHSQARFNSYV